MLKRKIWTAFHLSHYLRKMLLSLYGIGLRSAIYLFWIIYLIFFSIFYISVSVHSMQLDASTDCMELIICDDVLIFEWGMGCLVRIYYIVVTGRLNADLVIVSNAVGSVIFSWFLSFISQVDTMYMNLRCATESLEPGYVGMLIKYETLLRCICLC